MFAMPDTRGLPPHHIDVTGVASNSSVNVSSVGYLAQVLESLMNVVTMSASNLKRRFVDNPTSLTMYVLILVILCILLARDAQHILSDPVGISLLSSSIAISELVGGASGFMGYREVYEILSHQLDLFNQTRCHGDGSIQCIVSQISLKEAVEYAANHNNMTEFSLEREDLGEVTYHKLSYLIFGFQLSSLMYFFFMVLIGGVTLFVAQFHADKAKMLVVISLLLGLLFVVEILPGYGLEIATVQSRRMFGVMAMIPALHLAFVLQDRYPISKKKIALSLAQAILLGMVLHFRSSAYFVVIFLTIVATMVIIGQRDKLSVILSRYSCLPIVILFLTLAITIPNIYVSSVSSGGYQFEKRGHLFWHAVHVGLGVHPGSIEKYNISGTDDASFAYVEKISNEIYGDRNWQKYLTYIDFERLIKERVVNIVKTDVSYVLVNYALKPIGYAKLFVFHIVVPNILVFLLVVLFGFLTGFCSPRNYVRSSHFSAIKTQAAFALSSFSIPMLLVPNFAYSVDFTILLTAVISGLCIYLGVAVRQQAFPLFRKDSST